MVIAGGFFFVSLLPNVTTVEIRRRLVYIPLLSTTMEIGYGGGSLKFSWHCPILKRGEQKKMRQDTLDRLQQGAQREKKSGVQLLGSFLISKCNGFSIVVDNNGNLNFPLLSTTMELKRVVFFKIKIEVWNAILLF